MDGDTQRAEGGIGPMVGLVIILLIIIIGGLYFWSTRPKAAPATPTEDQAAAAPVADQGVQAVQTQGTSDDAAAIQADLNATDVNSVDAGLQ